MVVLLAVAYLALAKRKYRAEAQLQLLTETTPASLPEAAASSGDALALTVEMQTYVGVLTSDRLALEVIQELDLAHTSAFGYKATAVTASQRPYATPQLSAELRDKLLKTFKKNLAVSLVSGSRIISISYQAPEADLAQRILETLLHDFTEYNFAVRSAASSQSAKWLESQLGGLKREVVESQERAAELQRETGIYGAEASSDLVLARLQQLNEQVTAAEENRIVKQAIRDAVKAGGAEAISNLSGAGSQSNMAGGINSLSLLQSLQQQQATLESKLAELTSRYGPNYPQVQELNNQLAAAEAQLRNEKNRLADRAENDYQTAMQQEQSLRAEYKQQEALSNSTHDKAIAYLVANQEAQSQRNLYQNLLARLTETSVQSGLHDTNIAVMDPARVGAVPSSPNVPVTIAGTGIIGLILGLCAVFLVDALDGTLQKPETASGLTQSVLLGIVPSAKKFGPLLSENTDDAPLAEAFREVRTAVLRGAAQSQAKALMVGSSSAAEGKTTVAFDLAVVLAQQGHNVLLIDADIRNQALTQTLGLSGKSGLSDLLTVMGQAKPLASGSHRVGSLDVIPAGTVTAHPAELLSSQSTAELMVEARASYDFILVDTPPLLSVSDASALARHLDAVILVCRARISKVVSIERAAELLNNNGVPILGCICNGIDPSSVDYRFYYGDTYKELHPSLPRRFA